MLERKVIVRVRDGLHARPATRFVKLAKSFASDIQLGKAGKNASAKSSVKVMLLTIKENDEINVAVTGEDEAVAIDALEAYLLNPDAGLEADDEEGGEAAAPVPVPAIANSTGLGASEGIAIGKVFPYFPEAIHPDTRIRIDTEIDSELDQLAAAIGRVVDRMKAALADKSILASNRTIISALLEIARDEAMREEIIDQVKVGHSAVNAIHTIVSRNAAELSAADDPYIRARADDFMALGRQLQLAVLGKEDVNLASIPPGSIVMADDLGAFELAKVPTGLIGGLVCARGSKTSHIAIVARSQGIPAVLGIGAAIEALRHATTIAMDGKTGEVVANPNETQLADFRRRQDAVQAEREALTKYIDAVPKSKDGKIIEVAANIGSAEEVVAALKAGAMAIGLFRTELLFMQHAHLPSEDQQFDAYAAVAKAMSPRPVIIRTLDIGGDKPVAGVDFPHEDNPFLGWRGIRMCLDRPDVFKPQLRALLRAAVSGNLKVMIPMVVDATEIRRTKALIAECKAELAAEGKEFKDFDLGIMVETPAAVLNAPDLARESAFFSIGTNDLTQYVMAADRLNSQVAALNDVSHPAVMNAIRLVAKAGSDAGIMVAMCGDAAAREDLIPAFVRMGVSELSMSSNQIPRAKRTIIHMAE